MLSAMAVKDKEAPGDPQVQQLVRESCIVD